MNNSKLVFARCFLSLAGCLVLLTFGCQGSLKEAEHQERGTVSGMEHQESDLTEADVSQPYEIFEEPKNGLIRVSIPKDGLPFAEVVRQLAEKTGQSFVYDSDKTRDRKMHMIGTKEFEKVDLLSFAEVLFFSHDFAFIPKGPPESEVILIEYVKTGCSLGRSLDR